MSRTLTTTLYLLALSLGLTLVLSAGLAQADPLPGRDVLKFSQLPMDGTPIFGDDGTVHRVYGHDEWSTAYSSVDPVGVPTPYVGQFMADDFADRFNSPVVHVKWWGSYRDNFITPDVPVDRFLISFESDVPAGPAPSFSHPGVPLLNQIVDRGILSLGSGTFTEKQISLGGDPLNEHLYEYNAELNLGQEFFQQPDTVYWLKIVALVDLPPGVDPATAPRWGWHNRDYTVNDPLASVAPQVVPGEYIEGYVGPPTVPTPVWHFQDDAVTGNVTIDPFATPDLGPLVFQDGYQPTRYIGLVDGPPNIEQYSKDLAFQLFTVVPEPASTGLACFGALGLGMFARRRRQSGSCRKGSNTKTWIAVAAIIVSGLLPGEAWAVQKEIFGLASQTNSFHILRYDVIGNSFYDCGTVASNAAPTTNLAMDANRRLYYMYPFQGGHDIWKADLDGSNNLINQLYVNTLAIGQNLDIIDGFTIGPYQDLYMTGYGHSEIYRYDLGVNNGFVTTEVKLVAGPNGTIGEFRSDLAFDTLTNYLVGIGIVPDGSGRRSLFQIPNALAANGLTDSYVWEFFGGNSSPWASATFDLGSPTNPGGPLGPNPDGVAFDPTNGDLYLSGDGEKFSLWDRTNATLTNYLVGSAGQDTGMGFDLAFQTVTTVPEPATWALAGIGCVGALGLVRRTQPAG
jgi:hypothetical protein